MKTRHAYWVSADGQGHYDMGEYSADMSDESIYDAVIDELLSQCGEIEQAAAIQAGTVTIERTIN